MLAHKHDDYMGKSLIPLDLMGSLNWVLGEQLSQVIVSTWLHGHREHRWGHNTITMHKHMDMHKNREGYINTHMYKSSVSVTLSALLHCFHYLCAAVTSYPQ